MILYVDSSALVKRYVAEHGSDDVAAVLGDAVLVGTSIVTRAEVAAAFAKARRVGAIDEPTAVAVMEAFRADWPNLVRIAATEHVVGVAETLAWQHGLRGYDAMQLASAVSWRSVIGQTITVSTFDKQLWDAAGAEGFDLHPARIG